MFYKSIYVTQGSAQTSSVKALHVPGMQYEWKLYGKKAATAPHLYVLDFCLLLVLLLQLLV